MSLPDLYNLTTGDGGLDFDCTLPNFEISPQDLESIQAFLNDNTLPFYNTPQHTNTLTTPSSNVVTTSLVGTETRRIPIGDSPKRSATASTTINAKVKKPRATPKKPRNKRTASSKSATSTASKTLTASPSPSSPPRHRSIDELLAANFYSLSEEEKARLILPMLRNFDPSVLEASLAELPNTQAHNLRHELHLDHAFSSSSVTPDTDGLFATQRTYGLEPPLALATRSAVTSSAPRVVPTSPSSGFAHVEVNEDFGTIRQREALEKAASQEI